MQDAQNAGDLCSTPYKHVILGKSFINVYLGLEL